MTFILTRIILPGTGAVCVDCLSRGRVAAMPLPAGNIYTFGATEQRTEHVQGVDEACTAPVDRIRAVLYLACHRVATRLFDRPSFTREHLDHIPPDRPVEPGIVMHVVAEPPGGETELFPCLSNGTHGATSWLPDMKGLQSYLLTLRLDGGARAQLYGYQVAPECLEPVFEATRDEHLPLPRSFAPLPTKTCEHETDAKSSESAAVPATVARRPEAGSASAILRSVSVEPCQPPIQVRCFGSPRVMCGGQQVWPRFGGGDAKPWELLLYLACQPAEGIARKAVVRALWRDADLSDDDSHRFRQLRYRLRRQLQQVPGAPDGDGICLDRHRLRLDPKLVWSDAQQFVALVRSARTNPGGDVIERLEQARALYTDDLLEGHRVRRNAWIDDRDASGVTPREHFRRLHHKATERLAELYAEAGDLQASSDLYRELTETDPAQERLWLESFRLHARIGDRDALIAEERRLRQVLRKLAHELDAPTTPDITEPSQQLAREFSRLLFDLRRSGEEHGSSGPNRRGGLTTRLPATSAHDVIDCDAVVFGDADAKRGVA